VATDAERAAMRHALTLAATPGVPLGPNPRVGAVLLDADGAAVGEGWHRGAGTPHAEVAALVAAGPRARGATAVVTLEPCGHTGRTGPCAQALIDAGVTRVVFAQADPNPVAAGGAALLAAAGLSVESGLLAEQADALNHEWSFAVRHRRPFVTWKLAATLDGRVAAADGTSRWITGPEARADVHAWRGRCDAVVVGTGTALADDPRLTARDAADPVGKQPLRVVVGHREVPATARVRDDAAPFVQIRSHDPTEALAVLFADDVQHVYLEGGPTLAGAFVAAGAVDRVVAYYAPRLLGAGRPALADAGVPTLADAPSLVVTDVRAMGADVRVVAERRVTLTEPEDEE
jgi:diaminohydroxyphosphoribosylaminopyrimidine deaminase / 5-amino-6-(5-phosphoribosylamino)uracil reductase